MYENVIGTPCRIIRATACQDGLLHKLWRIINLRGIIIILRGHVSGLTITRVHIIFIIQEHMPNIWIRRMPRTARYGSGPDAVDPVCQRRTQQIRGIESPNVVLL